MRRITSALLCAEGDVAERLRSVGEVKCIAASSDGRLLGVGTEDGTLAVLEVPSMRTKAVIKCASGLTFWRNELLNWAYEW